jgi:hypothetical protein
MVAAGKRILLTGLVFSSTTKLVNACSYSPEFKDQIIKQLAERDFNVKLYFYASVLLIVANVVVFFVRDKKDYLVPFAVLLAAFISAPITLMTILTDMCGNSIVTGMKINFFIFLGFLAFQICLWANRTDMRFNRGKTTIDLR